MPKYLLEDMVKVKQIKRENPKIKNLQVNKVVEIGHNKNRPQYMLWFVAFISVAFCFFAFSFLFSKAEVIVNPKIKDVVLNEDLSAIKNSNANGLSFDLVIIPGEESKTIQATTEKDVKESATGTVVIYNTLSSSQALNIDTRLEASNGKIYKTQAKTVVPRMSKNIPGSIEVNIYGNAPGADYNSTPLDFKILGFKGTSKYSKVYARSKGDITGGFVGKAPDISDTDKTSALADLKSALQVKLLQKATDQIPGGFILFKDAIFLNTDNINNQPDISSVNNKDNSMTLTQRGTLYGLLFNEQELTKKIAEDNIEKYDGSEVYIQNIKDLTFSLSNKDNVSFGDVTNIDFNLSGTTKIVYKLDVNKFTADLLGKSKNDFNQILSQYVNIDSATLTLSPVWKMSIPDKSKDIKIIVNYPQ